MLSARKLVLGAIMLLIVAVAAEFISYTVARVLQSRWAMWKVPQEPTLRKEALTFDQYMARRDPVLGWPYPEEFGDGLDLNGAIRNPHFPDGGAINEPCLSLYGDSFTEGGDVSEPERRWSNVLSKKLNCYVANYGMPGYGTDQAYVRFIEMESDSAPVTIFGYHTGDTLRNLTRIRDLENYSIWYALKPRFIYDDATDDIEFIPIPELTADQYFGAIGARGDIFELEHENLQPNGPAGVVRLDFPYTVSLARNLLGFYGFKSRLAGKPDWMEFLQPDHPLDGLEITVAITRDFVDLAEERGKAPLVVILPHPEDLEYFEEHGEWPYRHVVAEYERKNIPFEDFGPHLLARAQSEGSSFWKFIGRSGHYNDEGNAALAEFVIDRLAERGLVPE